MLRQEQSLLQRGKRVADCVETHIISVVQSNTGSRPQTDRSLGTIPDMEHPGAATDQGRC
jgi:hypothetical protein